MCLLFSVSLALAVHDSLYLSLSLSLSLSLALLHLYGARAKVFGRQIWCKLYAIQRKPKDTTACEIQREKDSNRNAIIGSYFRFNCPGSLPCQCDTRIQIESKSSSTANFKLVKHLEFESKIFFTKDGRP